MARIQKVTITAPTDLAGAGWHDTKGGMIYAKPFVAEGELIPNLGPDRLDPATFKVAVPAGICEYTAAGQATEVKAEFGDHVRDLPGDPVIDPEWHRVDQEIIQPVKTTSWWCGKHSHIEKEDAEACIKARREAKIERVRE